MIDSLMRILTNLTYLAALILNPILFALGRTEQAIYILGLAVLLGVVILNRRASDLLVDRRFADTYRRERRIREELPREADEDGDCPPCFKCGICGHSFDNDTAICPKCGR